MAKSTPKAKSPKKESNLGVFTLILVGPEGISLGLAHFTQLNKLSVAALTPGEYSLQLKDSFTEDRMETYARIIPSLTAPFALQCKTFKLTLPKASKAKPSFQTIVTFTV